MLPQYSWPHDTYASCFASHISHSEMCYRIANWHCCKCVFNLVTRAFHSKFCHSSCATVPRIVSVGSLAKQYNVNVKKNIVKCIIGLQQWDLRLHKKNGQRVSVRPQYFQCAVEIPRFCTKSSIFIIKIYRLLSWLPCVDFLCTAVHIRMYGIYTIPALRIKSDDKYLLYLCFLQWAIQRMQIDILIMFCSTVECHYKAAQYNQILHTSLPSLEHNINHFQSTKNTPYTPYGRAMVCLLRECWIKLTAS